jgi:hypothetical protein
MLAACSGNLRSPYPLHCLFAPTTPAVVGELRAPTGGEQSDICFKLKSVNNNRRESARIFSTEVKGSAWMLTPSPVRAQDRDERPVSEPSIETEIQFSLPTAAETAHPAGIGHEKLFPAVATAHPGKALLEIAAFQELAHDGADDRSPEAIACLVALLIEFWM